MSKNFVALLFPCPHRTVYMSGQYALKPSLSIRIFTIKLVSKLLIKLLSESFNWGPFKK
jgi:hypothetical protein